MTRFTDRRRAGTAVLLAAAFVAGCSSGNDDSSAQMDSALARDLALASASGSAVSTATFGDTAINASGSGRSAAAAPAPRVTPPPQPSNRRVDRPAPRVAERTQPRNTETRSPAPVPAPQAPTQVVTTPAPVTTSPVPAPQSPAGSGTVASGNGGAGRSPALGAGAILSGRTTQAICSIGNRPGDRFVVNLANDVVGADGAVLPAGTPVLIELASTPAEGPFGFRVKSVQVAGDLVAVQGSVRADGTMTERRVSEGNDKAKVLGGAAAGAILGRVLGGGGKGTAVGAAAGAAAGTIAAARSGKVDRCLPAGSAITVTLSSPLVLASGTQ